MIDRDWALGVMSGRDRSPGAQASRALLTPLSGLYAAVLRAYWGMYRSGLLRRVGLPCPVVSIGNLTVGGTGKTAVARLLARGLLQRGFHPGILSYGYHGAASHAPRWVSTGTRRLLSTEESGDEAALLADALPGVPVLIGKRRVDSGRLACQNPPPGTRPPDCLILDDGFQYWRLHRNVDLVLVDATNPFGYGYCLPRGLLREPFAALRRADAFLVTRCDQAPEALPAIHGRLERVNPAAPVWHARYKPVSLSALPPGAAGSAPQSITRLAGAAAGVITSLGNPESFESTVAGCGARVIASLRFPDHHGYTAQEITEALGSARARGAELVVTSDKDAVKLESLLRDPSLPVYRLNAELEVEEGDLWLEWIAGRLRGGATGGPAFASRDDGVSHRRG